MSYVTLDNLRVSYDGKVDILNNLNLAIEKGELVSLLGPSGCGKSTTLRIMAGLINADAGEFTVDGQPMTHIPVHKRQFGMVFQSYALFPHLNVRENIGFGLKMKKVASSSLQKKVDAILEATGLSDFADRYPKQLSGGQRQRVALARALVIEPKLLLLDEPLSNLDAKLRISMRTEIKRIQRQLGITTVFVTHDQEECFSISDKVAVMNQGVIEQFDTPEAIYRQPATEFVARFIGFENFIAVTRNEDTYMTDLNQPLTITHTQKEGSKVTIRPDDIQLMNDASTTNTFQGTVRVRTFLGKSYQYDIETPLGNLTVNDSSSLLYHAGDTVTLYLPADKLILV